MTTEPLPKRPKLTQQPAESEVNEIPRLIMNQTVRTVIQPSLFAQKILPFVLAPKDRLNCMLVCREWHRQLSTSPSAWRHIKTLRVTDNEDNKSIVHIASDNARAVTLRLLSTSENALKPDDNVRNALQLMCKYVKRIKFVFENNNTAFTSDGAKTFFDWLNDGTLQLPNVEYVLYYYNKKDGNIEIGDVNEQLSQFDRLLQTTLRSHGQQIGIKFANQKTFVGFDESNTESVSDCQPFKSFLINHGHKIVVFLNALPTAARAVSLNSVFLSICAKPEHTPVRLQKVRLYANTNEDYNMAMDLLNKQTSATLTHLDVNVLRYDSYLSFLALQPSVVKGLKTLFLNFLEPDGTLLTNTCVQIAERCPKLFWLEISTVASCRLKLQQFTTIIRHLVQPETRQSVWLRLACLILDEGSEAGVGSVVHYNDLPAERLLQALVAEFGEDRVKKVELLNPDDPINVPRQFILCVKREQNSPKSNFGVLFESPKRDSRRALSEIMASLANELQEVIQSLLLLLAQIQSFTQSLANGSGAHTSNSNS